MDRKFKRSESFEIDIRWNTVNDLTATFDYFNASLINKSIIS